MNIPKIQLIIDCQIVIAFSRKAEQFKIMLMAVHVSTIPYDNSTLFLVKAILILLAIMPKSITIAKIPENNKEVCVCFDNSVAMCGKLIKRPQTERKKNIVATIFSLPFTLPNLGLFGLLRLPAGLDLAFPLLVFSVALMRFSMPLKLTIAKPFPKTLN